MLCIPLLLFVHSLNSWAMVSFSKWKLVKTCCKSFRWYNMYFLFIWSNCEVPCFLLIITSQDKFIITGWCCSVVHWLSKNSRSRNNNFRRYGDWTEVFYFILVFCDFLGFFMASHISIKLNMLGSIIERINIAWSRSFEQKVTCIAFWFYSAYWWVQLQ